MAQQVKLALEAICLEEQGRRSVWVMALFGKGAPLVALLRLGSGQASILRDGPAGVLRSSGRGDGTPVPQGERPTTLAGHPEEARFFRAVSKDQGERIRKRIHEMLHLGGVPKTKN